MTKHIGRILLQCTRLSASEMKKRILNYPGVKKDIAKYKLSIPMIVAQLKSPDLLIGYADDIETFETARDNFTEIKHRLTMLRGDMRRFLIPLSKTRFYAGVLNTLRDSEEYKDHAAIDLDDLSKTLAQLDLVIFQCECFAQRQLYMPGPHFKPKEIFWVNMFIAPLWFYFLYVGKLSKNISRSLLADILSAISEEEVSIDYVKTTIRRRHPLFATFELAAVKKSRPDYDTRKLEKETRAFMKLMASRTPTHVAGGDRKSKK